MKVILFTLFRAEIHRDRSRSTIEQRAVLYIRFLGCVDGRRPPFLGWGNAIVRIGQCTAEMERGSIHHH